MGGMRRGHDDEPAVITTVPISNDDEYDQRKKRYAIMMAIRAAAVILAACLYQVSIPLAIGFAVAGVVLPWCAVLIANDGPVKKKQVRLGPVAGNSERALPPGDDRIVDG